MNDERWLSVPRFEHLYEISDLGRVRRALDAVRVQGTFPGKIIVGGPGGSGYWTFTARDGFGGQRTLDVHATVCEAFHGPKPAPEYEARHLDGNRRNNRADNLAWGTHKQNQEEMVAHGRSTPGSKNGHSKLTETHVAEIKRLYRAGWTQVAIAAASEELFGVKVANTQVHHIVTGKQWKHVS